MATLIKHNGEWKKVDADSLLVTEMPVSADVGTTLLYAGETTASYITGHVYQYQQTSLEPVSYDWVDISMNGVQPLFQIDLNGADPSSYTGGKIYQALTDGATLDGVTVTKGHFYTAQENESSGDWEWTEVSLSGETIVVDQSYDADSTNAQSGTAVAGAINTIKNALFPVGSVYMTIGDTSPATLLGFGTWSKLSDGYLRVGGSAATGGSLTTGGHAITEAEMPSHSHSIAHTHTVKGSTGAMSEHSTGAVGPDFVIGYNDDVHPAGICTGSFIMGSANVQYVLEAAAKSQFVSEAYYGQDISHTHPIDLTSDNPSNTNSGNVGGDNEHTHSIEPMYTRIYAWQRTA